MTNVFLYQKNGRIQKIEIDGHSGFAEQGEDIVCAAISILSFTAINAMLEMVDQKTPYVYEDGYLKVEIPSNLDEELFKKALCILETIVIGLKSIEVQYDSYIRIKYKEV